LAALVESIDHVCTRYRLRAFEPGLREAGHMLEYHPLPQNLWGRLNIARPLADADAVILQRKLLSSPEVALLRGRVKRLYFDIDDAVWMRDSFSPKGFDDSKRRSRFTATVRAVDGVVAGNSYLAGHALQAGARASWVIPTCVDVAKYPLATHDGDGVDLVWVGSSSTLQGLSLLKPVLEEIGKCLPNVRLKMVCDCFFQLEHLCVVETPWSEATEMTEIASSAIGISWVPDDPWSRGKCGLKLLQYMAAGLPVVTNPVGVHTEMVRPGENGFLATSATEWIVAVRTLALDRELRQRMGANGRRLVEEKYSVEAGTRLWRNLLDGIEAGPVPG
jgi:glycosyltransferase involved in cell wall biosynthesis